MGFVWVQDIASGAVIDAVDAIEIRTNVDTVDNEKCAAEKVADQSTNYPAYCNDEHTGYLSNDHGTYQSGYLAGVDSSNYPGYYSNQNTGYKSGDLAGVDTDHFPGLLLAENTGYDSGYLGFVESYHYPGILTFEQTTVHVGNGT